MLNSLNVASPPQFLVLSEECAVTYSVSFSCSRISAEIDGTGLVASLPEPAILCDFLNTSPFLRKRIYAVAPELIPPLPTPHLTSTRYIPVLGTLAVKVLGSNMLAVSYATSLYSTVAPPLLSKRFQPEADAENIGSDAKSTLSVYRISGKI